MSKAELLNSKETRISEALKSVPEWVTEYLAWHKVWRNKLNNPNSKYLVLTCHAVHSCTGFSDRLKSLPFYLLLAKKTNRLLFIKWEKFQLEDFFLPPENGLDWRLPERISIGTRPHTMAAGVISSLFLYPDHDLHNERVLKIRPPGKDFYSSNLKYFKSESKPHGAYTEIMNLLLEPVPALENEIQKELKTLNLSPKSYISVHVRGPDHAYVENELKKSKDDHQEGNAPKLTREMKKHIDNSIECVIQESESNNVTTNGQALPIYFTSNDIDYIKYAVDESPHNKIIVGLTNILRLHSAKPLKRFNFTHADPTMLYPAFVDLWLMRYSQCVAYGQRGFGRFGFLLSGGECGIHHSSIGCLSPAAVQK